jgi:plasmid stabilization system protein ParE
MIYTVEFNPRSRAQLRSIVRYITRKKSAQVARDYARDITAECLSLNTFPHRGTARDDLALGIRTMGFRDRVTILFRISDKQQTVSILSILYGGRSLEKEIPYIR